MRSQFMSEISSNPKLVTKYFFTIFLSLLALLTIILTLIYYQAKTFIPPDTMAGIMDAVFGRLIPILAVSFVAAAAGSWYLLHTGIKNKQLSNKLTLDEQLLNMAADSIFVHNLNGNRLFANKTAKILGNYNEPKLTRNSLQSRKAPEFDELIEPKLTELVEKGELTFEAAHLCSDQSSTPVEVHSRIIGLNSQRLVLSIVHDITERKRTEEELRRSAERLRRAMEGTIHAMASTAEVKDPYTAGHQQRVTKLACAIAKEMGLPEIQIEGIDIAGSLHDMGKICIPSEILSKPGSLRKSEFDLIKDHPEVGYDLLKIIDFSYPVAQIVLQHHERLDGSGYPGGLSGENIMIEARIIAVADVVEAMASHRPYRPAFNIEKALLEIIQKKGSLYDPVVVDACVRLFNNRGFTFN